MTLTPEQREVVERIKAQRSHAHSRGGGRPRSDRGVDAARIAHDEGVTFAVAAVRVGCSIDTVSRSYAMLYPDERRRPGRRPEPRVEAPPREPSRSERAARLARDEGLTYAVAAERFGISIGAVKHAVRKLYPGERRQPGRREEGAPVTVLRETRTAHGTRSRYILGCRCEHCRRANTAYETARQRKDRASHAVRSCAYCASRPSTHADEDGFACCDRCDGELPAPRPVERGYEPSGGLPTHAEGAQACRNDPAYRRAAAIDEAWSRAPGEASGPLPDRGPR